MSTIHDVAAYILERQGSMSSMKLQKLVFYAQACALVRLGEPLFEETFRAWAHGPVAYELFERHRGRYVVSDWPAGEPGKLGAPFRRVIDLSLHHFAGLSAAALSERTHQEAPWSDARGDARAGERSAAKISQEAMRTFYSTQDWPFIDPEE